MCNKIDDPIIKALISENCSDEEVSEYLSILEHRQQSVQGVNFGERFWTLDIDYNKRLKFIFDWIALYRKGAVFNPEKDLNGCYFEGSFYYRPRDCSEFSPLEQFILHEHLNINYIGSDQSDYDNNIVRILKFLHDKSQVDMVNTINLYLYASSLPTFPKGLSIFKNLKNLIIPGWIDLKHLSLDMYLGCNQLETLEVYFPHLGRGTDPIDDIEKTLTILSITGVKSLKIHLFEPARIPETIYRFNNLKELHIEITLEGGPGENITYTLPDKLSMVSSSLTHLSIKLKGPDGGNLWYDEDNSWCQNQFFKLEKNLVRFTSLEYLKISFPILCSESISILSKLKSLRHLNLSNSNLDALPAEIAYMNNLRYIDLSFNRLSQIPKFLLAMENLETIVSEIEDPSCVDRGKVLQPFSD